METDSTIPPIGDSPTKKSTHKGESNQNSDEFNLVVPDCDLPLLISVLPDSVLRNHHKLKWLRPTFIQKLYYLINIPTWKNSIRVLKRGDPFPLNFFRFS